MNEESGELELTGSNAVATNGIFEFTNLKVLMKPGTESALKFTIENMESYGSEISFLQTPWIVPIVSLNCLVGEHLTSESECTICEPGFYLLDISIEDQSCLPCKPEANCLGGS